MKRWILITLSVCTLAVVTGAGYWGFRSNAAQDNDTVETPPTVSASVCDVKQSVTAPGNLVNTYPVDIEMPADGSLEEILVQPGNYVKSGQVLARLDDPERFAAAVTDARLALLQAQQELDDLKAGTAAEQAQARLDLANAQDALNEAQRTRNAMNYPHSTDELVIEKAETDYLLAKEVYKEAFKEYSKYARKKLTTDERVLALNNLLTARDKMGQALATWNWYLLNFTEVQIAQADGELAVAQANLEKAKMEWDELNSGPDQLALDLAQAKVEDAQAKLNEAEKALTEVEIKAPFDGIVLEVKVNTGATLEANSKIMVLNDPRQIEIEATVTEEDFPLVKVGQEAEIYFDAMPEVALHGKISRILPVRAEGDSPLYTVYLSVENPPQVLVAGMTADASVVIAQVKNALCLPRSLVRASAGNTTTVDVWLGDRSEERTIELGLRGDTDVEILAGLEAGDLVVGR